MMQSLKDHDMSTEITAVHAGLLVASFTFGEFVTGILWGKVSTSIGRKPTLLLGVFGGMVATILFGMSKSVPFAVAARLFGGLINPNTGVVQTVVAEVVQRKEQQGVPLCVPD